MKKSDFVEVHIYVVNQSTQYGGGIIYSKDEMENMGGERYVYMGTTLITKKFFAIFSKNNILNFTYFE